MSDTYLQRLKASRDKATVAYHHFALNTTSNSDHLFCFFEGNDSSYYSPRISNYTDKFITINCGGREKVLKVFSLINNKMVYDKYLKAFFIDRDFNPPLQNGRELIYETPCYSIENLYVNTNVAKKIFINEFQLTNNDDDFIRCVSLFEERFEEFSKAVELINAWYSCLVDIKISVEEGSEREKILVQLDEKLPKGFVSFRLDTVESHYDVEKLNEIFEPSVSIEDKKITEKIEEFSKCNSALIFRGKYQFDFLITTLQSMIDDSKTEKKYIPNKISFDFDGALNHKRALKIFSNYADTPECLKTYISNILKKEIN